MAASLATGFFPTVYPNWSSPTHWLVGTISGLAPFTSVLAHEDGLHQLRVVEVMDSRPMTARPDHTDAE